MAKRLTALKAGDVVHGFEILEVTELAELKAGAERTAYGILARHIKSRAELFHILNGDEENLFAFAFATAARESTGIAHILEHTVLCGSEKYPLKDAFLVLCQGSLQTYLNAWTFLDKTVYPASSVNETDYFNLMSVYADAVFCPRLDEWDFMQEGHRLEYGQDGRLVSTGVVYNEMKGVYSAFDEYAGHWSVKSVLPDTPYAFDAGGDPACIPNLTYRQFRDFHKERYSPANCKVFLAGNIATEKQLAFLDEQYFSRLPAGTAFPPVKCAAPWDTPRLFVVPSPAGTEQKATVFLSWVCPVKDSVEMLGLQVLSEILMGHDGSPVGRALVESGFGEDLAPCCGLDGEMRETVFTVGLRGVEDKLIDTGFDEDRGTGAFPGGEVANLIQNKLYQLSTDGLAREDVEAALLSLEFSNREIRRAGGPYALVWLRRALRSWIQGGHPTDTLLFVPRWAELKKRIAADSRYFEKLIERVLLENPHQALVVVKPEKDFIAKQEKKAAQKLKRLEESLTEAQRKEIRDKAAALAARQTMPDPPELLARIPHLSVKDLSTAPDTAPREMHDAGGIPVLAHPLFTNGISYLDFAFPLDVLPPEEYIWLPLFARAITSFGVPGKDYGEMSSILARTVGNLHAALRTGGVVEGTVSAVRTPSGVFDLAGRDWFLLRVKMLDEKLIPSLDVLLQLFKDADFSDTRRLRDLTLEMKNEADSSIAPAGHNYAEGRASVGLSRTRLVSELWSGLAQISFLHTLLDRDIDTIKQKLIAIRETLLAKSGLLVNVTGGNIPAALSAVRERFASFGPVRPANEACHDAARLYPLMGRTGPMEDGPKIEVFTSASMQTGFAASAFPALPMNHDGRVPEFALCHQLATGALWEHIRMKGGAYGAFAQADSLEKVLTFSTYRDPDPLRSLEAFPQILEREARRKLDADTVEKTIIGAYAKIKEPLTNAAKGFIDLIRFFSNMNDETRERLLKRLVQTDAQDLAKAAGDAAKRFSGGAAVVIAGEKAACKAADALGVAVTRLPI
jgi:Zn-dependent M16 (insulinase) family peptidase